MARAILIVWTLMLSAAVCGTPEPHGKHFLALEDTALSAPPMAVRVEADAERDRATADDLARLEARLEQERLEAGPYAPQAAETLIDLARILDNSGKRDRALALREQALHLIRVNEGLYSPAQAPVLRAMLDSLRDVGDFEALDRRYDYFHRLYGAGRPPFSDLRWSATMEYLTWQREALRRGLDSDPRDRLLELHALQDELLTILDGDPQADWRWIRDLSRSQLAVLYHVEDRAQPEVQTLRRSQMTRVRGDDRQDFSILRERLANLQRTARARAQSLIEAALARVPEDEVTARAALRLDLADWLLWQGSNRSAREIYAQVWSDLANAGRDDLLAAWFSRPQPLPRSDVFAPLEAGHGAVLRVRIDVSAYGRVGVSSEEVPEALQREFSALSRFLRASRFRPAFRAGEPVDSLGLTTAWVLIED